MLSPAQLEAARFADYPPEARALAAAHIALLRRMPLGFLPLLLREVIAFDWKFPAERTELLNQFRYLEALDPPRFDAEMRPFAELKLSPELAAADWVNAPAQFSEQLSAHLWATGQIESFREASVAYVHQLNAAYPSEPPARPRLALVAFGREVSSHRYPLFRKLRPHGTCFTNIEDASNARSLFAGLLETRARQTPQPYAHWHVHGGSGPFAAQPVARLTFGALGDARDRLIAKMRTVMAPGGAGPEALRTLMARMTPADLGLSNTGPDGLLNRFGIGILTEGSGTQLFSTTFVQWSAREILRRAQPETLLLTYEPRQREQSMQDQISGRPYRPEPDPQGSLIDADMGAYYTWLNLTRLAGATDATFIACFDGGSEVMAVGPAFDRGKTDPNRQTLVKLLTRFA